jgi:hypothetical protein
MFLGKSRRPFGEERTEKIRYKAPLIVTPIRQMLAILELSDRSGFPTNSGNSLAPVARCRRHQKVGERVPQYLFARVFFVCPELVVVCLVRVDV